MAIDARDNDCTESSPCIGCENEEKDKSKCASNCDRLTAYRDGKPWEGIGGYVMGATKTGSEIISEIGDQRPETICAIEGCIKKVFCRGLSEYHYNQWRNGKIEHPLFGKYKQIQIRKVKKKEAKRTEAGSRKSGLIKSAEEHKLVAIQLSLYPKIQKAVFDEAENSYLPAEHIIITLIGEALAARKK